MLQTYEEYFESLERRKTELHNLCVIVCDKHNANTIYRILLRNGISSVDEFRQTDLNMLRRARNVGEMRMAFIEEMRKVIDT